ncbi:MAG: polyphosphate polymerase domain-containing protein [Lachnospiraceae bacterium]|nr:polyphosphate polymerase domain-containing protein [Lachnospiraceae bacterium]
MADKMTFQRYEIKYMLSEKQMKKLQVLIDAYMGTDEYSFATIRNVYYDTESFRLIRRSIEKPAYKEKLRVRSYAPVHGSDSVFVELKKKYEDVVYKRRMSLPEADVKRCMRSGAPFPADSQIAEEIDYFRSFYGKLVPAVFLSYDRAAYFGKADHDFRLTVDHNILYRTENFDLGSAIYGTDLLGKGYYLMEVKTAGGLPMWLTDFLSEEKIYKTSFSKYGAAYLDMQRNGKEAKRYA